MNPPPVRALVVDDSAVVRGLLSRALSADPGIVVAGTAMHGELALAFLRRSPADVVVLDIEMPVMDGIATLKRLRSEFPEVRVVVASSLTQAGAKTTIEALALGAAGCFAKPEARSLSESVDGLLAELIPLVKALGPHGAGRRTMPERALPQPRPAARRTSPRIVVIGSSTGGPAALREVLTALPSGFPLPIVIVQHMPPTFTALLAQHLAKDTGRPCVEAADGQPILAGRTLVAPGDHHLELSQSGDGVVAALNRSAPEHHCRPSVNPLFRSAARLYGRSVLAVMLTGMGDDGIEGTRLVASQGGRVIAQDEATSVVWGMPGAVVRENLADDVLPLAEIGPRIERLCLAEVCA